MLTEKQKISLLETKFTYAGIPNSRLAAVTTYVEMEYPEKTLDEKNKLIEILLGALEN